MPKAGYQWIEDGTDGCTSRGTFILFSVGKLPKVIYVLFTYSSLISNVL